MNYIQTVTNTHRGPLQGTQRLALFQTPPCSHNQEQTTWSAHTAPLSQPDSIYTSRRTYTIFYKCTVFRDQSKETQNKMNDYPI